jgi:hypothetical protein
MLLRVHIHGVYQIMGGLLKLRLSIGNGLLCEIIYTTCEEMLFLDILCLLPRYCCAISKEKRKRKISKRKKRF